MGMPNWQSHDLHPNSFGKGSELSCRAEPYLRSSKVGTNIRLNMVPKDGLEPSTPRL